LTHSGRLTHEVVTRQPWIRRRSGKVRQLRTDVLTTEPRRQHHLRRISPQNQCAATKLTRMVTTADALNKNYNIRTYVICDTHLPSHKHKVGVFQVIVAKLVSVECLRELVERPELALQTSSISRSNSASQQWIYNMKLGTTLSSHPNSFLPFIFPS